MFNMNFLSFHHYGLAVKNLSDAILFHEQLGYKCSKQVIDEFQNVELIFCTSEYHPSVELIKPLSNKSKISNYLKDRNGIIYHICYSIKNYKNNLNLLFKKNKFICVQSPSPAILFNNQLVSFYFVKNVGLIELLHIS